MSRSGPQPPYSPPVRRWVLYSRTNLAISVVGVVAVLSLVGMLVGGTTAPADRGGHIRCRA